MLARKQSLTRYGIAIAAAVTLTACSEQQDDALEPNDTFDQARPLILDTKIEASIHEESPDVFRVEATAGTVLRFDVEHVDHDPCPVFSVHNPAKEELLGQDLTNDCGFPLEQTRLVAGAAIEVVRVEKDLDYIITVPVSSDGEHFITLAEDSKSDNFAPFSWDYKLTASIGP